MGSNTPTGSGGESEMRRRKTGKEIGDLDNRKIGGKLPTGFHEPPRESLGKEKRKGGTS